MAEDKSLEQEHQLSRHRLSEVGRTHDQGSGSSAPAQGYSLALLRDHALDGRGNSGARAQHLQQMQRTHGNRAVQRTNNPPGAPGHVAVQRSAWSDAYANMEKSLGKDHPALQGHKWMLAMPNAEGADNGPYGTAGTNSYSGLQFEGGLYREEDGNGSGTRIGHAKGDLGAWSEDGARQEGFRAGGGATRTTINEGGLVSADFEAGTANAEGSFGESGVRVGVGATTIGGAVTVGNFDSENNHDSLIRVGASVGPSMGVRAHNGDSDGDGYPELGLGADIGFLSADFKTEDPIRFLGSLGGGGLHQIMPDNNLTYDSGAFSVAKDILGFGNVDVPEPREIRAARQEAFIAKRDKELADIEKNKDQIMKEQGAQAYYHKRTLASMAPQMRAMIEGAPPAR